MNDTFIIVEFNTERLEVKRHDVSVKLDMMGKWIEKAFDKIIPHKHGHGATLYRVRNEMISPIITKYL